MERRASLGRYRRTAGPLTVRRDPIQDRHHHRVGPRVAAASGRRVLDHPVGRTQAAHALRLFSGELRIGKPAPPLAKGDEGWFNAFLRRLGMAIIEEIVFQLPGFKAPPR